MEKIIKKIIDKLIKNGYEAYLVGGYVRDYLFGIKSYDVDICTNALPKDVHAIFNITGNNYGCCNFKVGKYNIDITTFRKELKYEDRKPTKLLYVNDLKEDLLRRDFTINAIAMNNKGEIIDLLNGINDLNNCVIRSIGDAKTKIKEDPLRILRTIRFACILNFKIDDELMNSIIANKKLVKSLSNERIKGELNKILMSPNFKIGLDLCQKIGLNITYNNVIYTNDLMGMWAQINFPDIAFTKEEKSNIIKIAEVVNKGTIDNFVLYKYGLYISLIAGDILGIKRQTINKMFARLPIKERKDIGIKSEEIALILNISLDKRISLIYEELEDKILKGEIKNNSKSIKKYLIQNKGKW